MTDASLTSSQPRPRVNAWFDNAVGYAKRHREAWPAVGIVVATLVAYHFTLSSLFDFLRLETPLAYLPLLPVFCVAIAIVTANRYKNAKQPIKDRQIDFLVGVPVIVLALLLITLAPVIASTYYWTDRADVVSMALFAAGATIIAYGVTWFWRLKASFIFLLLMWPALYLHVMAGVMQSFTDWTNYAMARIVHFLPIGASLGPQSGQVVIDQGAHAPITITIATVCSGADTVLGMALIGGSILTVMTGGRLRKLLWWIAGMVLAFALNIVRLTSIIAVAHFGQPQFALGGYHAVIGLVLFAIATLIMLWLLPKFGLSTKPPVVDSSRRAMAIPMPSQTQAPLGDASQGAVAGMTVFGSGRLQQQQRHWSVRRRISLGAVAALTVIVALADHGLQPYAAFDDGSGAPTVKPFNVLASAPTGWQVYEIAQYPWVTQYFGASATWNRYQVISPSSTSVAFADIVLTDDKGSLDAYNLENCFLFHNYDIRTSERIDLGGGVYGLLLNYSDPSTGFKWATVSWAWPVEKNGETFYERIALTSNPLGSQQTPNALSFQPSTGFQDVLLDLLNGVSGGHNDPKAAPVYHNVDQALQGEAYALVQHAVRT